MVGDWRAVSTGLIRFPEAGEGVLRLRIAIVDEVETRMEANLRVLDDAGQHLIGFFPDAVPTSSISLKRGFVTRREPLRFTIRRNEVRVPFSVEVSGEMPQPENSEEVFLQFEALCADDTMRNAVITYEEESTGVHGTCTNICNPASDDYGDCQNVLFNSQEPPTIFWN